MRPWNAAVLPGARSALHRRNTGDVVFFTVKDTSHGIIGKAADGTMTGPHYDPGFEPKGFVGDR